MSEKSLDKENLHDKLRTKSHTSSFHAYAYAYVHKKRSQKIYLLIRLLTFFDFVVPITIGLLVLGFGTKFSSIDLIITIGAFLLIIRSIFAFWAQVSEWNNRYKNSIECELEYDKYYTLYKDLAEFPSDDFNVLKAKFDSINSKKEVFDRIGSTFPVKEYEKRMGMRYALRFFKWECTGCKITPIDLKSTDCSVCGFYSLKHRIKNIL